MARSAGGGGDASPFVQHSSIDMAMVKYSGRWSLENQEPGPQVFFIVKYTLPPISGPHPTGTTYRGGWESLIAGSEEV